MNKLQDIISKKQWTTLISSYSPEEICRFLNFKDGMRLANRLFFDDCRNDDNQQFALNLVLELKNQFKEEWEKDWKNDVFLGNLYSILCLYDERYQSYKRAYDKLQDPPAKLLLFLAGCVNVPGIPPITEEEAESYLRNANERKVTSESAIKMRTLCEKKGDKSQAEYWDKIYRKLEREGVVDLIVPDVLQ